MDAVAGTITKVSQDSDATLLEVKIAGMQILEWRLPNMTFIRLGYEVGSEVSATIDDYGNLQGVQKPFAASTVRPFKM